MNNQLFEKIESYMQGELSPEEKKQFEAEMASSEELSSIFTIYKTVEHERRGKEKYREDEIALKNTLQHLNEKHFETEAKTSGKVVPFNSSGIYKIVAVAACLILVVAGYLLFYNPSEGAQQPAANYTNEKLVVLSQMMDGASDSLKVGIAAHNKKDYNKALEVFEGLYKKNSSNNDAIKYIGIVYLVTEDYDKALEYFGKLSEIKGLFTNPGMFYKAVTLLQRNREGDKEKAIELLKQVVKDDAEGSEEAKEWLQELE